MQCPDSEPFYRTSDFYKTCGLPKRFEYPSWFHGYGLQKRPPQHPFYKTTSSDYGRYPPTVHTVPTCFHPNTQEFTTLLAKTGMYRNYSLNTGLDPTIY
ncbi:PREDICTED: UPF0691 protein C9orf116 [Nicrophorus vespilloides]|uniref:UPF0691 protein C9orf116 n=1 Tax=Nicrophorus vespilloides TaxID=110193 RepID=A0ABM1MK13_NICVS|nr:PREDICTED: UPF0691 protein C9orf116 [Nicrophorus vespilloides]